MEDLCIGISSKNSSLGLCILWGTMFFKVYSTLCLYVSASTGLVLESFLRYSPGYVFNTVNMYIFALNVYFIQFLRQF